MSGIITENSTIACNYMYATNTRSQAVTRIADRTAKNCRGHVTRPRPLSGKLFVRLLGIPNTKPPAKFEVSSSSSFGDMFDHIPKIVG